MNSSYHTPMLFDHFKETFPNHHVERKTPAVPGRGLECIEVRAARRNDYVLVFYKPDELRIQHWAEPKGLRNEERFPMDSPTSIQDAVSWIEHRLS